MVVALVGVNVIWCWTSNRIGIMDDVDSYANEQWTAPLVVGGSLILLENVIVLLTECYFVAGTP